MMVRLKKCDSYLLLLCFGVNAQGMNPPEIRGGKNLEVVCFPGTELF